MNIIILLLLYFVMMILMVVWVLHTIPRVDLKFVIWWQAAQWAIENELMTLRSSEHPDKFNPHVPVSTVKAIRAWKKAQQMKPSAK